uniref:KIB1-4 beta-propeller domain-containing protein n=1 Tax=Oryza brachyantha TaxID=4533 RepID=J3LTU2_ORYBR
MTNGNAWATPRGWILIRDAAATFLPNPRDPDDKIQLAHLPEALHSRCSCVLSGKPTIPGCVVLLVEPVDTVIWYFHVGEDEEWTRHEYDIGIQMLDPPIDGKDHEKTPICSIGAYQGNRLAAGHALRITDPIAGGLGVSGAASEFSVESENDLYMVCQLLDWDIRTVYDVTVYKMDFSKHKWCVAEDIGGRVFLIAPWYFGPSCSAEECGLEKDRVCAIFAHYKYFEVSKVEDGETDEHELIDAPYSEHGMWILPTET